MLRLRPYKKCDAKYIVSWIKDEFAFRQWCADRFENYPVTEEDINKQYEGLAFTDSFYPMTIFDEKGVTGHLIMRFTDDEKTILRFGFVIIDDSRRGQGIGKEMLLLAQKYAFEILKVQKITLGVFKNNPSAYYCYKAAGFKEILQNKKEYYNISGEDWECIEMECTGGTRL